MDSRDALSERIERAALESLHAHCPPAARQALGLRLVEVGDALCAMAAHDGSVLINRALGLGTRQPVTPDTLAGIVAAYREIDRRRFFLHVYPETVAGGEAWLKAQGLEQVRGWRKFHRGTAPPPVRETDLSLRRVGPEHARDFGAIVATAFGMTEPAAALLGGLASDPDWHLFMTFDGETPAGAGGL